MGTRRSLRPLIFFGRYDWQNLGRVACRDDLRVGVAQCFSASLRVSAGDDLSAVRLSERRRQQSTLPCAVRWIASAALGDDERVAV